MADVRHLGRHSPELTAAVEDAAASLVLLLTREYAAGGPRVSTSQLRALLVLREGAAMNVTALAESLGALPSSASRLCDRLAAAGLVVRSVRREDRREVTVQLTADGSLLLEQIELARRHDLHAAMAKMTPKARAELLAGLTQLSQAMVETRDAAAAQADHNPA